MQGLSTPPTAEIITLCGYFVNVANANARGSMRILKAIFKAFQENLMWRLLEQCTFAGLKKDSKHCRQTDSLKLKLA